MSKPICVITCHGFTGYPEEMNPLGQFLQERGYDWKNLQLPGHGTSPEDLKKTNWKDWTSYTLKEVDQSLKEYDNHVIMAGLSLGGVLTLYALIKRPKLMGGITLATPFNLITLSQSILLRIPFLGFWVHGKSDAIDIFDSEMKKNHRSYSKFHSSNAKSIYYLLKNVKNNIQKINQPILIIHSKKDQIVNYENANIIYKEVKSKKKEIFLVENSSHVLTKDFDRTIIFQRIDEFLNMCCNPN